MWKEYGGNSAVCSRTSWHAAKTRSRAIGLEEIAASEALLTVCDVAPITVAEAAETKDAGSRTPTIHHTIPVDPWGSGQAQREWEKEPSRRIEKLRADLRVLFSPVLNWSGSRAEN